MVSYADFLGRYNGRLGGFGGGGSNPLVSFYNALNGFYNNSHGSAKYALANLPIFGQIRNYIDQAHKAQDQYDRTHTDSPYIDRYIRSGTPGVSDIASGALKPQRMVKSLAKMYGVEVELDLVKEKQELERSRRETARAYATNAVLWHDAWDARNNR